MMMIIVMLIITRLPFNQKWTTHKCEYLVTFLYPAVCWCDLDLDLMTLIYEVDLVIMKVYLHTKNEVSRSRLSKVKTQAGQTDRHI